MMRVAAVTLVIVVVWASAEQPEQIDISEGDLVDDSCNTGSGDACSVNLIQRQGRKVLTPPQNAAGMGYTFDEFVARFPRDYAPGTPEFEKRKLVFEENQRGVIEHNGDTAHTYKRAINRFSDLSKEEFALLHFGYAKANAWTQGPALGAGPSLPNVTIPDSLDWREAGVMTDVKDQGQCGSCWAFAATEVVESHVAINSGTLMVLSPQQLLDCAPNPHHCGGSGGCFGSTGELAFEYIQEAGMTTEWVLPYVSYFGKNASCSEELQWRSMLYKKVEISGYVKLPTNVQQPVMQALVSQGPLVVTVQADDWMTYSEGVFNGCTDRDNINVDHAVVLTGYGSDAASGSMFWLVRNSWGADWGEKGYIRLLRTEVPECGTDSDPAVGIACANNMPETQHVCGTCGILFDVSYPLGADLAGRAAHGSVWR